jgi:hypothetical protein
MLPDSDTDNIEDRFEPLIQAESLLSHERTG